ncbi:MAG TPA: TlpA disulfide reductase family protein [Chitinophagaceae bacterium]|nr:TlpA disulfide reductase family protein [Chitinophagaceae bacterium]
MKRLLIVLAMAPLAVMAQPNSKATVKATPPKITSKGFTIEGKLDGYADGTEILMYKNGENTEMAKTKSANGKFTIKGSVEEPVLCFLIIGSEKPAEIYVENSIISFKSKKAQPPVFEIEGSASHKDFDGFVKTFMPIAKQLNALATTVNNTPVGPEREKLVVTYNAAQANLQEAIDKFVKDKPRSVVTPFVLNVTYSFNEDIMMLERRFLSLDEKLRKSTTGIQLQQFIAEGKIGAVGTDAPDFSQPDTTGTPVSLSSFRGKYVLVDFWASWCGPCRAENPNVVENYKKFANKNFTVLGVSLDRPGQKNRWIDAIKEDNLTWTHVSDLQFWSNAAAQMYKVSSIPQNILIDPKGKIVGRNLRGPALGAKLCELLGCETKGF